MQDYEGELQQFKKVDYHHRTMNYSTDGPLVEAHHLTRTVAIRLIVVVTYQTQVAVLLTMRSEMVH